jgi:chromosome segregation ATPase
VSSVVQAKSEALHKVRADLADARRREPALTNKISELRAALQSSNTRVDTLQAELSQMKQVAAANRDTIMRLRSRNESAQVCMIEP